MSFAVVSTTSLIRCSFGMVPTPLMIYGRTVMAEMMFMGNITDCVPFLNILPFGMCWAPTNPAVIAAGGIPVPCTPVTTSPWISEAFTVEVQGFPAIDQTSILMCDWLGIITIMEPGNFQVMVP